MVAHAGGRTPFDRSLAGRRISRTIVRVSTRRHHGHPATGATFHGRPPFDGRRSRSPRLRRVEARPRRDVQSGQPLRATPRGVRRRLVARPTRVRAPTRSRTTVTIQRARTIIARNDSPDIPFTQSINPYQGCEHGCIYCYARPTHAYLDLSPGLDFETKLFAKPNAAALLRAELAKPGYAASRSRSAPTPIRTSRSSASGRSRARSSRCSPSTSIRSRS